MYYMDHIDNDDDDEAYQDPQEAMTLMGVLLEIQAAEIQMLRAQRNELAAALDAVLAAAYEPVEDDCRFCGAERYPEGYRHDGDCLVLLAKTALERLDRQSTRPAPYIPPAEGYLPAAALATVSVED